MRQARQADRRSRPRLYARSLVITAAIGIGTSLGCAGRNITGRAETAEANSGTSDLGGETPALEGPDDLVLAPLVALSAAGLAFDHEPIEGSGLEPRLHTYSAHFAVLHPGESAPRDVLLACSPSVSSDRIFSVFETARRSGFDHARLVFTRATSGPSPTADGHSRRLSAARVSLADTAGSQNSISYIRSWEVQNCAVLSERVVTLRRSGQAVTLLDALGSLKHYQPSHE